MEPSNFMGSGQSYIVNVLSIEIQGDPRELEQRVGNYVAAQSTPGRILYSTHEQIAFELIGEDEQAFGRIIFLYDRGDMITITFNRVIYPKEYEDFNNNTLVKLRKEIPRFIHTLTEGIAPGKILSLENRLDEPIPQHPSTVWDEIQKNQEQRRSLGFYKRTLLDAVFYTTPELLMGVMNDYQQRMLVEGQTFWNSVEFFGFVSDRNTSTVGLYILRRLIDGLLGQVVMVPTSAQTTSVKITSAADIWHRENSKEEAAYFLAVEALIQLAVHLIERISVSKIFVDPKKQKLMVSSIPDEIDESSRDETIDDETANELVKAGKPSYPWYDAAYAYKEKGERKHSNKQAFDWMIKEIDKDKNIDKKKIKEIEETLGSTIYGRFRAAMNYRRRKDRRKSGD
jgi:hypothetical protein